MGKPLTALGDALVKKVVPAAPKLANAMAPKQALPTMEQHADALHPVNITPNRVTGKFSGE